MPDRNPTLPFIHVFSKLFTNSRRRCGNATKLFVTTSAYCSKLVSELNNGARKHNEGKSMEAARAKGARAKDARTKDARAKDE